MKIDKEIFFKNLALTQPYCEQQIQDKTKSTARVLRSLNFGYQNKPVFEFEWNEPWGEEDKIETVKWNFEILDNDDQIIKELFKQQLIQKGKSPKLDHRKIFKGKILVSEFEHTPIDGASEAESKGLVDIYEIPPIDTWFYMSKHENVATIFAWIPEKFVVEIQTAIDVNVVDMLSWLENWDADLYKVYQNLKP